MTTTVEVPHDDSKDVTLTNSFCFNGSNTSSLDLTWNHGDYNLKLDFFSQVCVCVYVCVHAYACVQCVYVHVPMCLCHVYIYNIFKQIPVNRGAGLGRFHCTSGNTHISKYFKLLQ